VSWPPCRARAPPPWRLDGGRQRAARGLWLVGACTLILFVDGQEPARRSREPDSASACAAVRTHLLPQRWVALRDLAGNDACAVDRRTEAVQQMAQAGPYANLVLPKLEDLARGRAPAPLRGEAARVRRYLLRQASRPWRTNHD
jgi:hypothetical protein